MTVTGALCCDKPMFINVSDLVIVCTEAAKRCNVFMCAIRPYCRCLELPGLAFFLRYNFTRCDIEPDECCIIVSDAFCAMFDPLFQNGKLPTVRIKYLATSVVNLLKRFLQEKAGFQVVDIDARVFTLQKVLVVCLEVVAK